MCKRLLLGCFVLAILCTPAKICAQFTDPHSYDNTPVGSNQVEFAYAYARANASIDTSVIVTGARVNLNQGSIGYTQYFGFVHRLFWVKASLPLAGLNGSISGTNIQRSVAGTGDTSYELAALLKGGPALSVAQFENYKPTTTVGMSLSITAPTGLYTKSSILAQIAGRSSRKLPSRIRSGLSRSGGSRPTPTPISSQTTLLITGWKFSDNSGCLDSRGTSAIPSLTALWVSLDTRYSFRGATLVGSVNQNNGQQNFSLGSEVNVSLNARHSIVFEFDKALVHQNGPALSGFAVKYNFTWGRGSSWRS